MKSLSVSVFWPSWVWINNPSSRWLFASYSQKFAQRDSMKTRSIIKSKWYQDRWCDRFSIRKDQSTKLHFENNHSGGAYWRATYGVHADPSGATIPEGSTLSSPAFTLTNLPIAREDIDSFDFWLAGTRADLDVFQSFGNGCAAKSESLNATYRTIGGPDFALFLKVFNGPPGPP